MLDLGPKMTDDRIREIATETSMELPWGAKKIEHAIRTALTEQKQHFLETYVATVATKRIDSIRAEVWREAADMCEEMDSDTCAGIVADECRERAEALLAGDGESGSVSEKRDR